MARLPRTGFLQNWNRSESGTLMVYFQGLRLNYGAMQSNPDALQRAVFAGHKRDPRKSACRKRSPHSASILYGTSNLELTIMPGRDHE